MSFVNYQELVRDTLEFAKHIPKPDLVVGVPRSGLLPANILALHWNIPITTPDLLLKKQSLGGGTRLTFNKNGVIRKVLVIDDSYNTGAAMTEVKVKLSTLPLEFSYGAIYCAHKENIKELDYAGKWLPQPRFFQWNWLHHHPLIGCSAFDIDGVLCRPPTPEENDYGPGYEKFLKETEPWFIPSLEIGCICTGRLEKYRGQTEAWLKAHNVKYKELVMRIENQGHPWSKIELFKSRKDLILFVEDELPQAVKIFEETKKRVLCLNGWRLFE